MKFYKTGYEDIHIVFVDDDVGDIFECKKEFVPYRFAGKFPDYTAIKKELRNFIDALDPMGFDPTTIKETFNIPRFGMDPRGYGNIYETLFTGHDIKYIVIIRRLSFYWFNLEIFEDKRRILFRKFINNDEKYIDDILKTYKPIRSFRFCKFK